MTDIRSDDEAEVLELDAEQEAEQQEGENQAQAEAEEDVLYLGEEEAAAPEPETDLVKHLRQQIRDRDRRLSEAKKQPQAEEPIVVGERPTMEGCDYDEDRFYQELDAFEERKTAKAEQDRRVSSAQTEQAKRWEQVQVSYADKKKALPFADKETVEATAFESLSDVQQAVIASVADNPALVIYAAGKNGARLAALAAIDDPLKLAREIGKMEATMTVKKRTRAPDPDTPVRGSTVAMSGGDKELVKLQAEAARTGDRSAVAKYIREQGKK